MLNPKILKMNKILMYHSIGQQCNEEVGTKLYCVSEEKFRAQLLYNKELLCLRDNKCKTPEIIITFDDGDATNYITAFSLLKEYGLKAYFFIIASRVEQKGYMNWEQIKELSKSGMIIGSHGMTHRILTLLSPKELNYELRKSKEILEDRLKQPIDYFSIPRGFYNQEIINMAKEIGYKTIFASDNILEDEFLYGRIAVKGEWSIQKFKEILNGKIIFKDEMARLIKKFVLSLIGIKNYDRLRTAILKKC
jgi:peptidoglycan/xylan/chitin deacetylase (PgdA/CDA1 family)